MATDYLKEIVETNLFQRIGALSDLRRCKNQSLGREIISMDEFKDYIDFFGPYCNGPFFLDGIELKIGWND